MPDAVICFDVDGTLVDKEERIHPSDFEILEINKSNFLFVPCTGRSMASVVSMFHMNHLFTESPLPFPVIAQNGSSIYAEKEELIAYNAFPEKTRRSLIECFEKYPDISFSLMHKDRNVLMHPNKVGIFWMKQFNLEWESYLENDRCEPVGKATCFTEDPGVRVEISEQLAKLSLEYGVTMSEIVDINPQGVNKYSGLIELLDNLNLADLPVFAAGDGENDLALFTMAKACFSPASAPKTIRDRTDYVIDVSQNGILNPIIEIVKNMISR